MKIERRDGADSKLIERAVELAEKHKDLRDDKWGDSRAAKQNADEYRKVVGKLGYDPIS